MNLRLEDHLTLALALITAWCLKYCDASESSCSYLDRPHPQGFCGERLLQLHRNVCSYLRREYPDIFGSRSKRGRSIRSIHEARSKRSHQDAELSWTKRLLLADKLEQDLDSDLEKILKDVEARAAWTDPSLDEAEAVGELDGAFGEDVNGFASKDVFPDESLSKRQLYIRHHLYRDGTASQQGHLRFPLNSGRAKRDWYMSPTRGREAKDKRDNTNHPLVRGKRNLVCECCYDACSVRKVALYC